jgi:hypothetical protein
VGQIALRGRREKTEVLRLIGPTRQSAPMDVPEKGIPS